MIDNRNVFKKKKKVYIGLYQIPPPPPPQKKTEWLEFQYQYQKFNP